MHEIGHCLGLKDSKNNGSVMFGLYYMFDNMVTKLHDEDVRKIQVNRIFYQIKAGRYIYIDLHTGALVHIFDRRN